MISNKIFRYLRGQLTQTVLLPAMSLPKLMLQSLELSQHTALPVILCVTSIAAGSLALKWRADERAEVAVHTLINVESGLATDYLINGCCDDPSPEYVHPQVVELFGSIPVEGYEPPGQSGGIDHSEVQSLASRSDVRGVAKLDSSLVEVKQHRKVRRGAQMKYMNCVIAECKAKFASPDNNTANHKAVNRFANGIMVKHGLRPSHIKMYLPIVVQMTFIPNDYELEAAKLFGVNGSVQSRLEYLIRNGVNGLIPSRC